MRMFPRKIDEWIAVIDESERAGVVPPKVVIEQSLMQMRGFIAARPGDNALVNALKEKLGSLQKAGRITASEREILMADAIRAFDDSVQPGAPSRRSVSAFRYRRFTTSY